MATSDFDQVIDQSHLALAEFVKGNPQPLKDMYSHEDDVTLANPFGPAVRGWKQAAQTMERAAANYSDGQAVGFDGVAKYVTDQLAFIVEVERYRLRVSGGADLVPVTLRVTSIFRPEDGVWKIMHRHADPIDSERPAQSVVQR